MARKRGPLTFQVHRARSLDDLKSEIEASYLPQQGLENNYHSLGRKGLEMGNSEHSGGRGKDIWVETKEWPLHAVEQCGVMGRAREGLS